MIRLSRTIRMSVRELKKFIAYFIEPFKLLD